MSFLSSCSDLFANLSFSSDEFLQQRVFDLFWSDFFDVGDLDVETFHAVSASELGVDFFDRVFGFGCYDFFPE